MPTAPSSPRMLDEDEDGPTPLPAPVETMEAEQSDDPGPNLAARKQQLRQMVEQRQLSAPRQPTLSTLATPQGNAAAFRAEQQGREDAIHEQAMAERETAITQRRQQIAETKATNSSRLAEFKSTGQQHYKDPYGNYQPVIDAGTNRPLYDTTNWEDGGKHPQTGEPTQIMRDKYGQRQYRTPPVVAGADPRDGQLYYKYGPDDLRPAGDATTLKVHKNPSVARLARQTDARLRKAMWQEALLPMEEAKSAVDLIHDKATQRKLELQNQIEQVSEAMGSIPEEILKAKSGGILGVGAKPTPEAQVAQTQMVGLGEQMQALILEQAELDEKLKPMGELGRMTRNADLDLKIFKIKAAHETYLDLAEERRDILKQQGKPEAGDPTLESINTALKTFGGALQRAAKVVEREAGVARQRAPVTAPAEPTGTLPEQWAAAGPLERLKMMGGSKGFGPNEVEGAVPMIGSEAAGTKGGLFTIPKAEGTGTGAGIINAANKFSAGLTTPENAAILAATGGTGALAEAAAGTKVALTARAAETAAMGAFTGVMAKDTVAAASEARKVLADPKATDAEKADAVTSVGLAALMTGASAAGTKGLARKTAKEFRATPRGEPPAPAGEAAPTDVPPAGPKAGDPLIPKPAPRAPDPATLDRLAKIAEMPQAQAEAEFAKLEAEFSNETKTPAARTPEAQPEAAAAPVAGDRATATTEPVAAAAETASPAVAPQKYSTVSEHPTQDEATNAITERNQSIQSAGNGRWRVVRPAAEAPALDVDFAESPAATTPVASTETATASRKPLPETARITIQEPQGDVPGYQQIDLVGENGESTGSFSPEQLREHGFEVPDISSLKTGQYEGDLRAVGAKTEAKAPAEVRDQSSGDGNFSYTAWESGDTGYATEEQMRRAKEIPSRADTYRPGHLTMGKDVDRGLAIQRARGKRQRATNWEHFKAAVLPKIKDWINPMSWQDIAQNAPTPAEKSEIYKQGGWVRHEFNGQEVWTHPEATPKKHGIAQAITERRPVSSDVNPKALPTGYELEGDQYVFRGEQPASPVPPTRTIESIKSERAKRYNVQAEDGKIFIADGNRKWAQIGNTIRDTPANRTRLEKMAAQLESGATPEPTKTRGGMDVPSGESKPAPPAAAPKPAPDFLTRFKDPKAKVSAREIITHASEEGGSPEQAMRDVGFKDIDRNLSMQERKFLVDELDRRAKALEAPAPAEAETKSTAAKLPEVSSPGVVTGEPINKNWTAFGPESQSLGVPRAEMPQVKSEARGALVNFLKARGIDAKSGMVMPSKLKPTQAEFSPEKVQAAREHTGSERPILISSDGHVVDGHHQWMAALDDTQTPMPVIRLNAPIEKVLAEMKDFPSTESAAGAATGKEAPPAPKATIPLSDRAIAALQKAKIRKPGQLGIAAEPFSIAYDAAIDLAILGIRAGRKAVDVIKLAIDRFKAKHPQHTPEELARVEAAVRSAVETPPAAPTEGAKKKSLLPESLKDAGAPAESIEYAVRQQDARKQEAADIIRKDGAEKAEEMMVKSDLPGDTRVAIGGQLINERMLALSEAKPEEVSKISRDIQRITAKMQPELATAAGQQISMFAGIYRDVRVAAATEYIRSETKKRVDALGGKEVEKAAQEAADAFNATKDQAAREKAIEKLKEKYTTAPVRKTLDQLKRVEVTKHLNDLGALTRDDMIDAAGNALGLPGISAKKLQHLSELADRITNAKNHAERSRAELDLASALNVYKGVEAMDVASSLMTANILSGYTTQAANIEGNALNLVGQLASTAAVNPTKLGPLVRGFLDGLPLAKDQAKSIWQTGRGTRDFQDKTAGAGSVLSTVDFARDFPSIPKPIGDVATTGARVIDRIFRFMKAADAVFYYPAREAYARMAATKLLEGDFKGKELDAKVSELLQTTPAAFESARKQATMEGYEGVDLGRRVADIIEERRATDANGKTVVKDSERFAAESTFTNEPEGLAGVAYHALKYAVQEGRLGKVPILKPWAMFLKTPANVFNTTLNYTPVGALRANRGMRGAGFRNPEWRNFTKDERQRLYLQSVVGTAIMGAMVSRILNNDGADVSAQGPEDAAKRQQLRNAGWSPYSIKSGDKWISYKDSPLLVPLAIVGHVADSIKYNSPQKDVPLEQRVAEAVASSPQTIFQTSMLTGLADLMGAMSGKGGAGVGRTLGSIPANLIIPYNRLLQQIDQTFDPQTYDNPPVVGAVPFARRMGTPQTDVQGRPQQYSPSQRFGSSESKDAVDALIRDKQVFIPDVGRDVKLGDTTMTDAQREAFRRISGQRIRIRLQAIAPRLRILTQEKAQDEITQIAREEREKVKPLIRAGVGVRR